MASVITFDGRRKRRSKKLGGVASRKYGSCGNTKWRCDKSKKACYATMGKGSSIWGKALLRAECYGNGKCKAEVLVGPNMLGRKRGLSSMSAAKEWACNKVNKG